MPQWFRSPDAFKNLSEQYPPDKAKQVRNLQTGKFEWHLGNVQLLFAEWSQTWNYWNLEEKKLLGRVEEDHWDGTNFTPGHQVYIDALQIQRHCQVTL